MTFRIKVIDPKEFEYFPLGYLCWPQEQQMKFTMDMAREYRAVTRELIQAGKVRTKRLIAFGATAFGAGICLGYLVFGL